MGACMACNAVDMDEEMFADANYTPHYTLLSDPIQERKTSSQVSAPIIKRKTLKRASTTFVQTMNVLGPVLRRMTIEVLYLFSFVPKNSGFPGFCATFQKCSFTPNSMKTSLT